MKTAAPYERGLIAIPYLRGLAYLAAGRAPEAMAEFERILDNPGWGSGPLGHADARRPLAHLGLARAATLAGDIPKARRAYQDLLALWKDADPDLPVLARARAEYAKLPQ